MTHHDEQRQKAFQKLRPVCVELSSVALRFRGHQAAVREVLHALETQNQILVELGSQNQLDGKLAEYAFFPLSHVLKESQRLSSGCMQVVIRSVSVLVAQGWRSNLATAMGQQLLVLMSLLAGGDPRRQAEPPTDELKCAAFECIAILTRSMALSETGRAIFQDQSTRNIVDQLVYLLAESLTDAESDIVQISAAEALLELNATIDNRVFLASLLPRVVSSLTKALRPSTQARRTRRVLITDLKLLGAVLIKVLADGVTVDCVQDQSDKETLDHAWLNATTVQVKNALAQVCKLRTHGQPDVRDALFEFGITMLEECGRTLKDSNPILIETLVVLSGTSRDRTAVSRLSSLLTVSPELAQFLQSSFYEWSQALPRVMQGSDDRPKQIMLTKITHSFDILNTLHLTTDNLSNLLGSTILKSITNAIEMDQNKSIQPYLHDSDRYTSLLRQATYRNTTFDQILFTHQSQKESAQGLLGLIRDLSRHPGAGNITRNVVDGISDFSHNQKLAPIWLAVQLLKREPDQGLDWDDILDLSSLRDDGHTSRVYLVQDLYAQTKDVLLESSPYEQNRETDPRITALVLESVILQAQQLGHSYRGELYETLYPILALLSSRDGMLRRHAVTALNSLAACCEYASVSALLIENVDYLVNSIAWKLNTFNLSPDAPAVLNMMIRLVGAKVIPYLDDLIASIFAALDSFHGYSSWVEMLFQVLKAMVDESVKDPRLAITGGREAPQHKRSAVPICTIDTILESLRARQRRQLNSRDPESVPGHEAAPHRPWTKTQDDPNHKPDPTEGKDIETLLREAEIADEENDLPAPKEPDDEDLAKPLNKSHELLLKIAQATAPHLSNPSARVRQTLLQLLGQISPLLARHENTFLPFIHDIWPAVIQRLFAEIAPSNLAADQEQAEGETVYNIAAAAEVVAAFCLGAGDFMTTRVEQIFPQLKIVYTRVWNEVEASMKRGKDQNATGNGWMLEDDMKGKNIKGAVNLQVIKNEFSGLPLATTENSPNTATHAESYVSMTPPPPLPPSSSSSAASTSIVPAPAVVPRTGTGRIFLSLVHLFVAMLSHVRLGPDRTDDVVEILGALLDFPGPVGTTVSQALEAHNVDAAWVMRCRKAVEDEVNTGARTVGDRVWRDVAMPVSPPPRTPPEWWSRQGEKGRELFELYPIVF